LTIKDCYEAIYVIVLLLTAASGLKKVIVRKETLKVKEE